VGFKPICCGDREDAELLLAASSGGVTIDEVNPLWLKTPAAPMPAAAAENVQIEPERLLDALRALQQRFDFVVVEGVGGWLVPIKHDYFVSDLAVAMQLPAVVVALNRLGCLNHTLLTVRSVTASGLQCVGVAWNDRNAEEDAPPASNHEVLSSLLEVPLLPGLTPEMAKLPAEWREVVSTTVLTRVSRV
jgi:dethiobiotin synthetase